GFLERQQHPHVVQEGVVRTETLARKVIDRVDRLIDDHFVDSQGKQESLGIINDALPFNKRSVNYRAPAVQITTPPNSEAWIYIVKRPDSVGELRPTLFRMWSTPDFLGYAAQEYVVYGLMIGGITLMAFYNLFLLFATRDSAYFYYVMFTLFSSLGWMTFTGLSFQYLFTTSTFIPDMGTAFFGTCAQIALWLFTQKFLQTKTYTPLLHRLLYIPVVMSAIGLVLYIVIRGSTSFYLMMIFMTLSLPFIGCWVWWRGFKSARFYVLAWSLFALSFFIFVLQISTGITWIAFNEKVLLLAHVLEILLLSFALGDRINRLNEEKVGADKLTADNQRKIRQLYSEKTEAERLARTDTLSGLNNRRGFFELGEPILQRAKYDAKGVSIIIVDIDYFKQINDTHGHSTGDRVIKSIALTLQQAARKTDIAARIGGEEFVLLIDEDDAENVRLMAERLRKHISETTITHNSHAIKFTASFGVAIQSVSQPETLESLLSKADTAMYLAKQNGRNQVVIASSSQSAKNTEVPRSSPLKPSQL
ncbi:MAG: diguanylate cyclase, partial [Pseudomonadota bacterium]